MTSDTIIPESIHRIAVTPRDITTVSEYIKVGIRNTKNEIASYDNHQYIFFEPNTTKVIEFRVGDIEYGDYQVYAEGQGNYRLRQTHSVRCEPDRLTIEIAPLSPFQLRNVVTPIMVLIQNGELRSVWINEGDIKFTLIDPHGKRFEFDRNEIDYSSRPIVTLMLNTHGLEVGEYSIEAIYKRLVKTHKFEVVESDPNLFTVKLDAYVLHDVTRQIVVDVETSTKTGELIEGQGILTFKVRLAHQPGFKHYTLPIPRFYERIQVTKSLRDLGISDEKVYDIIVQANIDEVVNGYGSVPSMDFLTSTKQLEKFKISPISVGERIHPGLRFFSEFLLKSRKGLPIVDTINPVTLRYGFSSGDKLKFQKQIMISNEGIFEFQLDIPSNAESLIYKLDYLGAEYTDTVMAVEKADAYIQARLIDRDTVEVRSTEYLTSITYVVYGFRDKVLQARTIPVSYRKIVQFMLEDIQEFSFRPTIQVFTHLPSITKKVISHEFRYPFENTCTVSFKGESVHLQRKLFHYGRPVEFSVNCHNGTSSVILGVMDENVFGGDINNYYLTLGQFEMGTQELSPKFPYFQTQIVHTE